MQTFYRLLISLCVSFPIPFHSSLLQQMLQGQPSKGTMEAVRQLWPAPGEVFLWLFRQMTRVLWLKRGKGFNMASRLLFLGCWEGFEHATVVSSTPKGPPLRTSRHRSCYCTLHRDKVALSAATETRGSETSGIEAFKGQNERGQGRKREAEVMIGAYPDRSNVLSFALFCVSMCKILKAPGTLCQVGNSQIWEQLCFPLVLLRSSWAQNITCIRLLVAVGISLLSLSFVFSLALYTNRCVIDLFLYKQLLPKYCRIYRFFFSFYSGRMHSFHQQ